MREKPVLFTAILLALAACGLRGQAPVTQVVVLPPGPTSATRPPAATAVPTPIPPTAVPPADTPTPDGAGGGGEGSLVLLIDFEATPARVHLVSALTGDEQSAFDAPGLKINSVYYAAGRFLFYYDLDARLVKRIDFEGHVDELPFVNSGTESFDVKFLPAPDGSGVAWGTSNPDPNNGNATRITLSLANVDGTEIRTVLDKSVENETTLPQPLQWSPDGSKVYFTDEPYGIGGYILFGGGPDLQSVDTATGVITPILPDKGCLCAMAVSPDGGTVAIVAGAGPLELVLHDVATGNERKAPIDPGHLQAGDILWSADGQTLVYTMAISNFESPEAEKYAIVRVDIATLDQKVLVPDDARLLYTAVWPEANVIWLNDKDTTAWLMAPDTGELEQVAAKRTIVTNR